MFFVAVWASLVAFVGGYKRGNSSLSPWMTTDGVGVSLKARIPAIEVSIPLIAKSVEKKETHAYRLRGGRPRMATRSKIVTRHKKGN